MRTVRTSKNLMRACGWAAALGVAWLGCAFTTQAETVSVTLDFGQLTQQLDGTDGASVCQFHSARPDGSAAAANVVYSTLGGFPDDASTTEFGKFCDTAFSSNGMALSQLWVTPCPLQTPPGSVGDHYTAEAWGRLDFSMYEPTVLGTNRFYNSHGKAVETRGHTVAMLQASARRARAEGARVCYWTDVHTDFPPWLWKDGLRKNPVRDECFEEAALHIVYFVKYLTAKHGIPIYAASFSNEPDLPNRHHFTPRQLLLGAKLLRERLDEAGLHGVRVMPCTAVSMNEVRLGWANVTVNTLNELSAMLQGPEREFAPYVDILAGHGSQSETPVSNLPPNTALWRASGDFNEHWTNTVGFDMGAPQMLDEVIRHNTWLYGKKVRQCGIWQIASRMGIGNDFFVMPAKFDPNTFGRREAIDGASVVDPFVRPGMFVVGGSLGAPARASYSVDGFAGRGHHEVVVISNSGEERTFEIRLSNSKTGRVVAHQATVEGGQKFLGNVKVRNQLIRVTVPPDSVTSLVGASGTPQRVYVVVKDRNQLTASDRALIKGVRSGKVEAVAISQVLTDADQNEFRTKRHPVDAFGAAAYVLSESIDRWETVSAYRTVMAPVLAVGRSNAKELGVAPGARVDAGDLLSFRSETDPPAEMLDGGSPRACGLRAAVEAGTISRGDLGWVLYGRGSRSK